MPPLPATACRPHSPTKGERTDAGQALVVVGEARGLGEESRPKNTPPLVGGAGGGVPTAPNLGCSHPSPTHKGRGVPAFPTFITFAAFPTFPTVRAFPTFSAFPILAPSEVRARPAVRHLADDRRHRPAARPAHRPAPGSGSARSHAWLLLCRSHRLRRPVRQVVRYRCEIEYHSGPRHRLPVAGPDPPAHPHPPRRTVPGRRETGRRRGQVQADARPHHQGQHAPRRSQLHRINRHHRPADRAAEPKGAGRPVAGAAHRPRRDHDITEGGGSGGGQIRPAPRLRRSIQFRSLASHRTASC